MKKNMLRVMVLGAALSAMSVGGFVRAADEPAKPADPPAQGDRPQRPRFNPADMLKNFRDQFEGINLTEDQMKKIDGFISTAEAEVAKAANSEDPETRRGAFQALRKLNDDVQSVLTDTQKTALRAKRSGMMFDRMKTTYTDDKLKLTDDQKSKINSIIDDAKKEAANLATGADQQQDRQKFFDLMRSTHDKLNAVLTPDQQKEVPQFGRGFGGRGRGSRGGTGGGNPPPGGNNQ